ncbi:hypothetical protein YC2023_061894 [Brassica napus]
MFLAVSRLTLHPWQLAPVVQNTVFTDRSRNHPGVRSLIGIRKIDFVSLYELVGLTVGGGLTSSLKVH